MQGTDLEGVTPDLWIANEDSFKGKLLKLPYWNQIPLLNCTESHNLLDGTLVRFRGMVQDIRNPEFFFDKFQVYNTVTKETTVRSGKYRDICNISEQEKVNYTENLISGERGIYVVISMPGFNDWAVEAERKYNYSHHLDQQPSSTKRLSLDSTSLKRSYNEAVEESDEMRGQQNAEKKEKKTNEKVDEPPIVSKEHLLNFPLPDVPSQACLVKTYKEIDCCKVNDMIEVVGFLSVSPELSEGLQTDVTTVLEPQVETMTHNPPPSLVPRLHAVHVRKLEHCNPLVVDMPDEDTILQEAKVAREHLLKVLTEVFCGDKLASEYLICYLVAQIYVREHADLILGQFSLNISNLPTQKYPDYGRQVYDLIQLFVTNSYYLPMTIDNMNTLAMTPKKDYECNRLTSGILQLSKGTHLVLDETKMEEGRFTAVGVDNLSALQTLVESQKVEYDFMYYKVNFDVDVHVLILSEGRSLIATDYRVPLRPAESSLKMFTAIMEATKFYLNENVLDKIRKYLTTIKFIKYAFSDDAQFIEEEIVEMKQNSCVDEPMTMDDMHRLLCLTRMLGLSRGSNKVDKESWEIAKDMENQRLHRIKNSNTYLDCY